MTGPTTSISRRLDNGENEYFGLSPEYAALADQISQKAPPRPVTNTFTGSDPVTDAPIEAPAELPPADLPYDAVPGVLPNGASVDAGNSGLDPTSLADLFGGFYSRPRTSTGTAPKQRGSQRIVA